MAVACFLLEHDSLAEKAEEYICSLDKGPTESGKPYSLKRVRFSGATSFSDIPSILEVALLACRKAEALSKWNILHLSESDCLRGIQLCLGEARKQECGEFCVQVSDVLAVHQRLLNTALYDQETGSSDQETGPSDQETDPSDQLAADVARYARFCADSRLVDAAGVLRTLRRLALAGELRPPSAPLLLLGRPTSVLEREVAAALLGPRPLLLRPDTDAEQQLLSSETVWHCVQVQTPPAPASRTQERLVEMLVAPLRLLVNTRDELAVAAACQLPGLDISAADFRAIRHAARSSGAPLYQVVVSHVRRAEFGRGVPELEANTAALRRLVDLLQKLQDILEDETDSKLCCLRLVAAVRSSLQRGCGGRRLPLEQAALRLRQAVLGVCEDYQGDRDPAVIGGPAVKVLRDTLDRVSCGAASVADQLTVLEDAVGTPGTPGQPPLALPSVVSLFRSPLLPPAEDEAQAPPESVVSTTPTTHQRTEPQPTPEVVSGPTLVCRRSGQRHRPGDGVRAYRQLQAADRAARQENQLLSPKSAKAAEKPPKRSLFHATNTGKKRGLEVNPDKRAQSEKVSAPAEDSAPPAKPGKKRRTEAFADQENAPAGCGPRAKKTKPKQIKQIAGQKNIMDFFRL